MRTVDPEQWFKNMQKSSKLLRFGRKLSNNFETRLRSSFCDAMREFWNNCSVGGMRRIFDASSPKLVRYAHITVFLLALSAGLARLSFTSRELSLAPQAHVNERSSRDSSQQILFPAVALCSTNIISKESLMIYTKFLFYKNIDNDRDSLDRNHTYDSRSIRKNLLQFGSLLTMNLPAVDVMFEQFLSHADPKFNVSKLMYQLSPPCATMLTRCSWRGRVEPCERLFATRATPLGYCCVFNSRYYPGDVHRPAKDLHMVGQDYGLSVVVQENPDDFVFVRRASTGLDVLLFEGSEYPILEGGGVRMYPVERNSSVYMTVTVRIQYPSEEGLQGCRGQEVGDSYSWCLVHCRWRTLAALCSCRFYTVPQDLGDNNPICSLTHLACLNKHKEKLIYYFPSGSSEPALDEELQNSQVCEQCAPDCARRLYSAAVAVADYSTLTHKDFKNPFMEHVKSVNSTVIRLFFASENQKVFVIEVNKRWFEIFASISGAWCGIVGATMVAASELVFFFTIRWQHHYRRRTIMVAVSKARQSLGTPLDKKQIDISFD